MRMTLCTACAALTILLAGPAEAAINYVIDVTLPVNYFIDDSRLAAEGEASFPQVILEPGPSPYDGDTATINASFAQPMLAQGFLFFSLNYGRDGPYYQDSPFSSFPPLGGFFLFSK